MTRAIVYYRPYWFFFSILTLLFASVRLLDLSPDVVTQATMSPVPMSSTEALEVENPLVSPIPDFGQIEDVESRKQAFFEFLQPYVDLQNGLILAQREELLRLRDKLAGGLSLTRHEKAFVSTISEEYDVATLDLFTPEHFRILLRRVDVIPTSLVLAQAANESAWGTSRFALEGNNFFGQWCYSSGCGIVPNQRSEGATHEVRAFANVAESVKAYFMNINTFPSYLELRRIRQRLRDQGRMVDGLSLSEGLESYSERGDAYIQELQSMIEFNDLGERDGSHRREN